MGHYETLGIPKDASPDQIKAAKRSKATTAHPDKGGSDEAMAKVNRAYDVLIDPVSRQRYDETGHDGPQQPAAMQMAVQTFAQILRELVDREDVNLVREIERRTRAAKVTIAAKENEARRNIVRLERRLKRIRFKGGGTNFAAMVIEQAVQANRRTLEQVEQGREVNALLEKMARDYEDETSEDEAPSPLAAFVNLYASRSRGGSP